MGITPAALLVFNDMAQKRLFAGKSSAIIEMGSQEIHVRDAGLFARIFDSFGLPEAQRPPIGFGAKGRTLFESLGFAYECVDLDGVERTQPWDLNDIECPDEFRERFVLTTNHGTTEHLIGQDNAFRLIHDLTAPGGYMMHTLPCTGQVDHGFFCYSPVFFYSLAKANGYEMTYFFLTDFNQLMPYQRDALPAFSYVLAVMQKTRSEPYRRPMQIWDWNSARYVDSIA